MLNKIGIGSKCWDLEICKKSQKIRIRNLQKHVMNSTSVWWCIHRIIGIDQNQKQSNQHSHSPRNNVWWNKVGNQRKSCKYSCGHMITCIIWQYRLWSFKSGDTKLERILPKDQGTQRKLPYARHYKPRLVPILFYPISNDHLCAVTFGPLYGLYLRAASNQEWPMVSQVTRL